MLIHGSVAWCHAPGTHGCKRPKQFVKAASSEGVRMRWWAVLPSLWEPGGHRVIGAIVDPLVGSSIFEGYEWGRCSQIGLKMQPYVSGVDRHVRRSASYRDMICPLSLAWSLSHCLSQELDQSVSYTKISSTTVIRDQPLGRNPAVIVRTQAGSLIHRKWLNRSRCACGRKGEIKKNLEHRSRPVL